VAHETPEGENTWGIFFTLFICLNLLLAIYKNIFSRSKNPLKVYLK